MVSNVVEDSSGVYTLLLIEPSNIFVSNDVFTEPGLVEHMAQSTAAINAHKQTNAGHTQSPKVGFIGAIKDLKIYSLPAVDTTILTRIEVLHEVMNAQIVKASTWHNDKEIATCELKIFIQQ